MFSSSFAVLPRKWTGVLLVCFFSIQLIFSQTTPQADGIVSDSPGKSLMQSGKWQIAYDLSTGLADISFAGKPLISHAYAEVHLPEPVTSRDYKFHRITHEPVADHFGRGIKYLVESFNDGGEKMTQTFWLYENLDYFLADVAISRKGGVTSNFMSPLTSDTPSSFLPAGDDRALFVPFDNDMWVRYDAVPFGRPVTSYEVSAFYDNASRQALIAGSIEHDTWKSGVESTTASNVLTSLRIFGGITSTNITHDVLPHGKISGETIKSPKIFIGWFTDWRHGLETYAAANAIVTPPRTWNSGVPFGWNSWGKIQFHLTYDKAIEVSDFFAKNLPDFKNDDVTYIGLDAGWDALSDQQLKEFVDHCHANHQRAGIYFTPFTAWTHDGSKEVKGTDYHYKDLFLYANGKIQTVDGGVALDPTHPGTQALIQSTIRRFQQAGFQYIKADFMTHGALEADHYYDPKVTTGIQAYNEGMKFLDQQAGPDMYLNLSISPLFPAQYANSRRIACDTFGAMHETEYMLTSLTYGWWLGKVYDFNDADHIVLDGHDEGENRARATSSAITGIFISGDDFSAAGSAIGKQRAKQFLVNPAIDELARIRQKSFEPVEGNTGDHAADVFSYQAKDGFYLAVFNYSDTNRDFTIDPARVGLNAGVYNHVKELWSGSNQAISNPLLIHLPPKDAAVYKFY
jgi:alpha-galactosidase